MGIAKLALMLLLPILSVCENVKSLNRNLSQLPKLIERLTLNISLGVNPINLAFIYSHANSRVPFGAAVA